jgi:hypothetical protein
VLNTSLRAVPQIGTVLFTFNTDCFLLRESIVLHKQIGDETQREQCVCFFFRSQPNQLLNSKGR